MVRVVVRFSLPSLLMGSLGLGACSLSAFEDLEGTPLRDAAASDIMQRDGGVSGDCVRPANLPLSLTSEDVLQLATQAEPEALSLRVPGPSAWLGAHRVFTFNPTLPLPSDAAPAPVAYASAALEGTSPPWTVPGTNVEAWPLADELNPLGVPSPLMPNPGPDPDGSIVAFAPTSLYRSYAGRSGGTMFMTKVGFDLTPRETWLAHVPDGATVISDAVGPLFTSGEHQFALGAHRGQQYVKVYACEGDPNVTDSALPGYPHCYVARAPIDTVEARDAYEAYRSTPDGQGVWDSDLRLATPVLFGVQGMLSVAWNNYLARYVAVYGRLLDKTLVVQTSKASEGPWEVAGEVSLGLVDAPAAVLSPTMHSVFTGCEDTLVISYFSASQVNEFLAPVAGTVRYVSVNLR